MSIFDKFKNGQKNVSTGAVYKMITDTGNGFYAWDGVLYHSDIVRACIKPKVKAIGKLVAKHIRTTIENDCKKIDVNPQPYIRMLLEEPNEFMCGQMLQEKVVNQVALNNNGFILIVRDDFGVPMAAYPIPCSEVECKYINNVLYLKFHYLNGKSDIFPYSDIIHLRDDFSSNDVFGDNPAPALTELMNMVKTIDQGMSKAIKNSGVIRWLLKYLTSMRDEDIKSNAEKFAENYLSLESSIGVAAVDAKAEAIQIQPHDYVPNSSQINSVVTRIHDFFQTNSKIINSTYTEDEWISYYEACIEPLAIQMSNEWTRKLFSRKERAYGNKIIFEASNLTYASMSTKLQLVQYVDRGIMTPNEVREHLNLAPIDGGDTALLRKDTGILTTGGEND